MSICKFLSLAVFFSIMSASALASGKYAQGCFACHGIGNEQQVVQQDGEAKDCDRHQSALKAEVTQPEKVWKPTFMQSHVDGLQLSALATK